MSHAGYIIAAFGISGAVVAAMIASIVLDHRALRRALAKYPAREGDQET